MLKPITNWSELREALKALGKQLVTCEDCGAVWLAPAGDLPVRCHVRDCRAWRDSPKRDSVGRPPAEG
jgi:hypothetical protein